MQRHSIYTENAALALWFVVDKPCVLVNLKNLSSLQNYAFSPHFDKELQSRQVWQISYHQCKYIHIPDLTFGQHATNHWLSSNVDDVWYRWYSVVVREAAGFFLLTNHIKVWKKNWNSGKASLILSFRYHCSIAITLSARCHVLWKWNCTQYNLKVNSEVCL